MAQRKPINLNRISPLTDFLRNHKAHIESLKESGEPEILTVNGRAEAVLLSTRAFQEVLDRLYRSDVRADLLEGMLAAEKGDVLDFEDAKRQIESDLDL
jgi:PHD/YefM family antitoxin component YafN of YafNO toxin-antitoxin module